MATRKKNTTPPGLKGAAYEVWLAGLGAVNLAGEEGGKIFKQLVQRGREQSQDNQEMLDNIKERAQGIREGAQSALGRITQPLESGLASAMQRMGVPTRDEILQLTHRVEELTRQVAKAKAASQAKPKPAPAKAKARSHSVKAEKAPVATA